MNQNSLCLIILNTQNLDINATEFKLEDYFELFCRCSLFLRDIHILFS